MDLESIASKFMKEKNILEKFHLDNMFFQKVTSGLIEIFIKKKSKIIM